MWVRFPGEKVHYMDSHLTLHFLSRIFLGVIIFKKMVKGWFNGPQALLAIMFSMSYCLAFVATVIFPNVQFDEVLSRSFERILLVVVSFYFGAKEKTKQLNSERIELGEQCLDCDKQMAKINETKE